jgi:hypothetical protein
MEDFVTFEIAKKLKEKGFKQGYNTFGYQPVFSDENTIKYISNIGAYETEYFGINVLCPTISQVLKWLRDEKNIHIGFGYSPRKKWRYVVMYIDDRFYDKPTLSVNGFIKIKDAALTGIEYVLDNLI